MAVILKGSATVTKCEHVCAICLHQQALYGCVKLSDVERPVGGVECGHQVSINERALRIPEVLSAARKEHPHEISDVFSPFAQWG